jgi:hypothetical protein
MRCVCWRPVEIEQTETMKVEIQQQDKEEFESLTFKDALSSSTLSPCHAPRWSRCEKSRYVNVILNFASCKRDG